MTTYTFATLDPRPANQEGVLAYLASNPSMGLEVTVSKLAEACSLGNIDPQHLGGDASVAAIEEAAVCPLPPQGAQLVTIRADADSVGAMAVLALREEDVSVNGNVGVRVSVIADADKSHSEWSPLDGFRPATTFEALRAEVMNFRRPLEERVDLVKSWLTTGEFAGSAEAAFAVEQERRETVDLLDSVSLFDDCIAVIESKSRYAVAAAYGKADVVVAINPQFKFGGGEPHRKVTVCQKQPGLVELRSVFADLNETEPGWGGSPTIGGSPQGESSVVATDKVVEIVRKHLI
ncbi:hypothetical protein CR983_00340 [Candidatus Saccharibacteria bacterium]|nr:MAG: hypothetical protein CR983_00340 [Candidatus Saccharibacteria bacterium]